MLHVFLDTNVILDYLLNRQPFPVQAAKILTLSDQGRLRAYLSALSFANCYYIVRQVVSHNKSIKILEKLCEFVEILDLKKSDILSAFKSGFNDFEDSLQHEAALNKKKIDVIISRDIKGFKRSKIEVVTPELFLKM